MGDSPLYKANLQMLDTVTEDKVITFMLKTFSQSMPSFSISNFVSPTVANNINNIFI